MESSYGTCYACSRPLKAIDAWLMYSYDQDSPSIKVCQIDCLLQFANKNPAHKSHLPKPLIHVHTDERIEIVKTMQQTLDYCHKHFHHSNTRWNSEKITKSSLRPPYTPEDWMTACRQLRQIVNQSTHHFK